MPITPEDVGSVDQITALSLSHTGDRVAYCVGPAFYSKGGKETQALWLADIGVVNSARQLTSGLFNDRSPKFDAKSGDIFFLSDRHKAGGPAQVYRLPSIPFGGDAVSLTPTGNTQAVSSFGISPDGRWLAYVSADEPAEKDEQDKETYVVIWREAKNLGRLRIIDLKGQIEGVQTIVSADSHVSSFIWSPDSTRLLYRLSQLPDLESNYFPVSEHVVSIDEDGGDIQFKAAHIVTHNRLPTESSVWPEQENFYYLHANDDTSAPALWTCKASAGSSASRVAFGDTDDAVELVALNTRVAVEVACGLETRIDVVDHNGHIFTAFMTSDDAFFSWDIKQVDGKYVFVVVRSSGVNGDAENVWSGVTEPGSKGVLTTKLSSHHKWITAKEVPQSAPFYWSTEDGVSLQGVIAYPRGQQPKSMPTVVLPHGGPYWREVLHLHISMNYRYLLASHGFLVLCPNYCGSQGRGTAFAHAAHGGMGTTDYADVESMLMAAIERGYADPEKVAIAGYSQGGFLAAWGITRPNAIWKGAVIGAGPTDWGSMIVSSDLPDCEAELGGTAPWSPRAPHYLQGSPIRDVKNVKVPVLLVHGEKDERVPLNQAVGFMRGLVREADKTVSDSSTLVIYPREGHSFKERAHVVDMLTRVLAYVQEQLR